MTMRNGSGEDGTQDGSEGAQPHVDVFQFLRDHNFQQKVGWFQIDVDSQKNDDAGAEKPKSESAKSKARQRANETKVKECYAKTENDADARALVSAVAKGIVGAPIVRAAMWLAIRNPEIVFLGEQVNRLGRFWRSILRAIVWCAGTGINRSAP